ncbi:MAG TPA: hypothetical protein VFE06_04155 [Acidobacteriaceae bacterium]|jgi:hypothetical protein|nr:hypothetical protein [Acidobacteriaceae bacterium]
MRYATLRLLFCAGLTLSAALAQNMDVPNEPFQAVHLMVLKSADAEAPIMTMMADFNRAIAKAGCPKCIYHLWKANTDTNGVRNYLWISSWPGRDVYVKIHTSAEYKAVDQKHPDADKLIEKEIYGRYLEMKLP